MGPGLAGYRWGECTHIPVLMASAHSSIIYCNQENLTDRQRILLTADAQPDFGKRGIKYLRLCVAGNRVKLS